MAELVGALDQGTTSTRFMIFDRAGRVVVQNNELDDLFDGPTAPLGSYSGKIRVAHALGIVGPRSFKDLKLIGQIRNRFAHHLEVKDFADPKIREWCARLALADLRFLGEPAPVEPRDRFVRSVANIAHLVYSELVAGTPLGEAPSKSP
jgi:DNA-binding MltR family transcriptional regulator